jgi:hypothetical protein
MARRIIVVSSSKHAKSTNQEGFQPEYSKVWKGGQRAKIMASPKMAMSLKPFKSVEEIRGYCGYGKPTLYIGAE